MRRILILKKQNMFTQACNIEIPIYEEIDFAFSYSEAADIIHDLIKDGIEKEIIGTADIDSLYILAEANQ